MTAPVILPPKRLDAEQRCCEQAAELETAYTAALVTAQMLRTPEAWTAAGEAWSRYFDLLVTSDAQELRDRKSALAARCRHASESASAS
jgi:hypothetical protein